MYFRGKIEYKSPPHNSLILNNDGFIDNFLLYLKKLFHIPKKLKIT